MNRISKRVIAFLLTLVLILSLCACAQIEQMWAGTDETDISIDRETPPSKPDKKPTEKAAPGGRGIGCTAGAGGIFRGSGTISHLAAGQNGFPSDYVRCGLAGLYRRDF